MIEYKILNTEEEFRQIDEFCVKNKLTAEINGLTIIALDDGELVGLINLQNVPTIELFISENSLVANNLFRQVEGYLLTQGSVKVRGFVTPHLEKIYNKVGFQTKFDDKKIMEKTYK